MLHHALGNVGALHFESQVLTKDGLRRHLAWSVQAVRNSDRFVQAVVLTGIDRTEQVDTRAQLQQATLTAEISARALRQLQTGDAEGDPAASVDAAEDTASAAAAEPLPDSLAQPFQEVGQAEGGRAAQKPAARVPVPAADRAGVRRHAAHGRTVRGSRL